MRKTILGFFVLAGAVWSQPLGFGIKGGLPFSDVLKAENTGVTTETKRYIVGPMAELRLPAGFAIEGNALYTKVNLRSAITGAGSILTAPFDTSSWEFPILLKKKFGGPHAPGGSVRPYAGAGVSFRRLTDITKVGSFITGNRTGEIDANNTGFVVGGGIEIKALFIRIAPEVRFTYWGTDHFTQGLASVFKTNKAQGQVLIGLYF